MVLAINQSRYILVMKFLVLFFVLMSKVSSFASTAINEGELKLFAATQVNDTFDQISRDIVSYLRVKGSSRLPEGDSAIFQAPLPGEKGKLDATITLLRFLPMQNQAIAEAQLKLVRSFLTGHIVNGLKAISADRNRVIQQVEKDNESLIRLVQVLTRELEDSNDALKKIGSSNDELLKLVSQMETQIGLTKKVLQSASNI